MIVNDIRRVAKIVLQEGDNVGIYRPPRSYEPTYMNASLVITAEIGGVLYSSNEFKSYDEGTLRVNLRDREISVKEVLPSDGHDPEQLKWEKWSYET